jgi:hypothetical protein
MTAYGIQIETYDYGYGVQLRIDPAGYTMDQRRFHVNVDKNTAHALIRDMVSMVGEPDGLSQKTVGEQLAVLPTHTVIRFKYLDGCGWEPGTWVRNADGWEWSGMSLNADPDFGNNWMNGYEYRIEYDPRNVYING